MPKHPKVCIIGAEGWGSAIATSVCKNVVDVGEFDSRVHIYVYDELVRSNYLSEVMNEQHENIKYLPGIRLPSNLIAINDLIAAARNADILIFATPHSFVKSYCNILAGNIKSTAYAISLTKGLEHRDGEIELYSHAITHLLGIPCYSMMNANSAMEMAQGKLCEITIGCNNDAHANQLNYLLQTENCMVFTIDDVDGVELCNTLKDLVALSAGFIDGLHLGENARIACLHLGLKEMMRFITNCNPTTNVTTFLESCSLANSVASAYGDKNVTFAKNFVTSQKTTQEIEASLLNGRKLLGPIIAGEIFAYLDNEDLHDIYPLFSIIHRICEKEVPPQAIVDTLRNHPDLSNFSVTQLQRDESPVSISADGILENIADTVPEYTTASLNGTTFDQVDNEEIYCDAEDEKQGFWKPYFHYFQTENNSKELEEFLHKSKTATGAIDEPKPDSGGIEISFEMGSEKDKPEICLEIKESMECPSFAASDITEPGNVLVSSQLIPNDNVNNEKSAFIMESRLQPIVMSQSGENKTAGAKSSAAVGLNEIIERHVRPLNEKYKALRVRVKSKNENENSDQNMNMNKDEKQKTKAKNESCAEDAKQAESATESQEEQKNETTESANSKKCEKQQILYEQDSTFKMRLFDDEPNVSNYLQLIRKKESEALQNDQCSVRNFKETSLEKTNDSYKVDSESKDNSIKSEVKEGTIVEYHDDNEKSVERSNKDSTNNRDFISNRDSDTKKYSKWIDIKDSPSAEFKKVPEGYRYDYKISIKSKKCTLDKVPYTKASLEAPKMDSSFSMAKSGFQEADNWQNFNFVNGYSQQEMKKGKLEIHEKLPECLLFKPITFKIDTYDSKYTMQPAIQAPDEPLLMLRSTDEYPQHLDLKQETYCPTLKSADIFNSQSEHQEVFTKKVLVEPTAEQNNGNDFGNENRSDNRQYEGALNERHQEGNISFHPRFSVEDFKHQGPARHIIIHKKFNKLERTAPAVVGEDSKNLNQNSSSTEVKSTSCEDSSNDSIQRPAGGEESIEVTKAGSEMVRSNFDRNQRIWQFSPKKKLSHGKFTPNTEMEVENAILDDVIPKTIDKKLNDKTKFINYKPRRDRDDGSDKKKRGRNNETKKDRRDENRNSLDEDQRTLALEATENREDIAFMEKLESDVEKAILEEQVPAAVESKIGEEEATQNLDLIHNKSDENTNFTALDQDHTQLKYLKAEQEETLLLEAESADVKRSNQEPIGMSESLDGDSERETKAIQMEDKAQQFLASKIHNEKVPKPSSEWDWLLDNDKFDSALEEFKQNKDDAAKKPKPLDLSDFKKKLQTYRLERSQEPEPGRMQELKIDSDLLWPNREQDSNEPTRIEALVKSEEATKNETPEQLVEPRAEWSKDEDTVKYTFPEPTPLMEAQTNVEKAKDLASPDTDVPEAEDTQLKKEWPKENVSYNIEIEPSAEEKISSIEEPEELKDPRKRRKQKSQEMYDIARQQFWQAQDEHENKTKRDDLQVSEITKQLTKIMTKGQPAPPQPKERPVDYQGDDPYIKENKKVARHSYGNMLEGDSKQRSRVVVKPFHPPLNPRVRIPRPPFDVRDHEYHTVNFRPPPDLLRTVNLPKKRTTVTCQAGQTGTRSVSMLPRPVLKLPPFMMRSSVLAIELGFVAAILSRYKSGRK
ncbi:uncharacterized protein Gpdh3 [Drosophila virilis]|uniref:Glycerol-3-phosphate dehydrogenase [NAD(+)] n=1 Tax=Drosophila virilis TaxID=7244 RepID=B4LXT4_DROVI|nr:uncharacterized protein LOC6630067 [Drosophila virilis]EDW67893.2 uncharacterized protein Dvir_GJ24413 [Drosophila virilis]